MNEMISAILKYGLETTSAWLWPEVCPFCGKASSQGICIDCRRKLEAVKITGPRCMRCGKPVRRAEQEYCYDCVHARHRFDRGLSMWLHQDPVNKSIYQFKYHNQRRYGVRYAEEIVHAYGHTIRKWNPDLILPIPLHRKRRKKRGYNQAAVISRALGEQLHIPVDEKSLVRRIYTEPQKNLGRQARKENLRHVFEVKRDFSFISAVLLVDDIYTTGNTIDAASAVLKKKGVEKVYFLTISIGQGY